MVTEQVSVEETRHVYAESMAAYMMGRSAPYAERFQFDVPQGGAEGPDESSMVDAIVRQTVGNAKDLLTGGEEASSGAGRDALHRG